MHGQSQMGILNFNPNATRYSGAVPAETLFDRS